MNIKLLKILTVLLILPFLSGAICSDDKETQISPGELEGIWQDTCQQVTQGELKNQISTFSFTGNRVRIDRVDYVEDTCATIMSTLSYENTFSINGNSDVIPGAKNLDYTVSHVYATFHTADGITNAKNILFCGFTDWELNVTKEITGAPCTDQAGDVKYEIYQIVDSDKLYIGSNEAVGDAVRPDGLRSFFAAKQ